jgi:mRNA interferase MazF
VKNDPDSTPQRGEIWWADLPTPKASEPGYSRPVLIVQSDFFNRSRIQTVVAVGLTSNLRLAQAPGNVLLSSNKTGLPKDSVANITQITALDKSSLRDICGQLDEPTMSRVETGLKLILGLFP